MHTNRKCRNKCYRFVCFTISAWIHLESTQPCKVCKSFYFHKMKSTNDKTTLMENTHLTALAFEYPSTPKSSLNKGAFVGSITVTCTALLAGLSLTCPGFSARHSYNPASSWVKSATRKVDMEDNFCRVVSILRPPPWWFRSNLVPFNHHQISTGGSSVMRHSKLSIPPKDIRVWLGDKIWALRISGVGGGGFKKYSSADLQKIFRHSELGNLSSWQSNLMGHKMAKVYNFN